MNKIIKTITETYNGFIRRGVYVEHDGEVKQYQVLLPDSALAERCKRVQWLPVEQYDVATASTTEKEIESAQAAMLAKVFGC